MQALLDAGADRVSIADTVGYADPAAVRDLFEQALQDRRRALLLRPLPRHARPRAGQRLRRARDRRRTASTPSLAGIGGCPHAPGASGNVERRPRLHAREHGHRTGIDIERLLALRAKVAGWLAGRNAARRAVARRPAEDLAPQRPPPLRRERRRHEQRTAHRPAARRHPRRRVHPHGDGPDLRDDPRRPRRRGDQGRAARRRQDAQAARAWASASSASSTATRRASSSTSTRPRAGPPRSS